MKEIEITAYKCKKCGKVHFPFHDRCLKCRSRDFETVHPKGNATLLAYTQIFNLPWGFDQRFLIIGVAEFENGVKAMGQVKAGDAAELKPGMKLKPSWDVVRVTAGEKTYGLVFQPMK